MTKSFTELQLEREEDSLREAKAELRENKTDARVAGWMCLALCLIVATILVVGHWRDGDTEKTIGVGMLGFLMASAFTGAIMASVYAKRNSIEHRIKLSKQWIRSYHRDLGIS